jgi:1-acyl-sn-glycerol-3-phosphate acyltransferase
MRFIALIYLVIGVLVAAVRNYFERLDNVRGIVSLLIAILLWPVVVFDVDVRIGGDDNDRNGGALLPLAMTWRLAWRQLASLRRSK